MMTMMATFLDVIDQKARSHYDEGKGLALRSLDPEADAAQLQQWFSMDYARFWSMQDSSVHQVRDFYTALCSSGHAGAWLGLHHGRAAFLVECYDPARDQVGEHYCVRPGDLGMHLLIAPDRAHSRFQPCGVRARHALHVRPPPCGPCRRGTRREQHQDPCIESIHGLRLCRAGALSGKRRQVLPSARAPNSSKPNARS